MAVSGSTDSKAYGDSGRFVIRKKPEELLQWLKPGDAALHFTIEDHEQYRMIPYYEIGNDEAFSCYPHFG
jgi:hypothetical protein